MAEAAWLRSSDHLPVSDVETMAYMRGKCVRDIWGDRIAMENATRKYLAVVAGKAARIPFHGCIEGKESNLESVIRFFPGWTLEEADRLWCASFVYYCCREAGFEIPIRPDECKTCHLAGCIAWEEFARGDARIEYHEGKKSFLPEAGDIVLYDRVFENREHDHMGIVLRSTGNTIIAAEGNLNNASGIIERPKDEHIRGYIRIPDGYRYRRIIMDHRTEELILHFVTEEDRSEVARTWPADHRPSLKKRHDPCAADGQMPLRSGPLRFQRRQLAYRHGHGRDHGVRF